MKRIIMTGGSGKAGKYVVRHLLDHGYQVLNLDSQKLDEPRARTDITDITDSGQVFNALTSYMGTHEFDPDQRPVRPDASCTSRPSRASCCGPTTNSSGSTRWAPTT